MSIDKNNIYISSGALGAKTVSDAFRKAEQLNVTNIELSSGLALDLNLREFIQVIENAGLNIIFHNYFPLPTENFVLNIASSQKNERERSISFIKDTISIARDCGVNFYSFHSGFCVDIEPNQLGNFSAIMASFEYLVNSLTENDISLHCTIMVESLNQIVEHAMHCAVEVAIENNNLENELFNHKSALSPLLFTNSNQILRYLTKIPNLGLLLDTAHLKVACKTMKLDSIEEMGKLVPLTTAFHVSENDGIRDSNSSFDADYSYLNTVKAKNKKTVIEVYNSSPEEIHKMVSLLSK